MTDFTKFNLPSALAATLLEMGYTTPTPIQNQSIQLALEGKDILGSAQTGTGKTAAYSIPLVTNLMTNSRGTALVLTPTRELATQVMNVIKKMLGKNSNIKTALLIGGESMGVQFAQLRNRPRLIVGTPGRINDHIERGTLMLNEAGFLVLDETDRMLDMGFSIQLDQIAKFLPAKRQTLMFSATMPHNINKIAQKYLNNPVNVKIEKNDTPTISPNLTHDVVHTDDASKYDKLVGELTAREGSIIVFVKTKRGAEKLSIRLNKQKFVSEAIHGDLKQSKRDRVIGEFRAKKHRILVATDVAARGLDIDHIRHVINFDMPHAAEDYIHRIGRTARAGAEGAAISFVSPEDRGKWRAISRLMNPNEAVDMPKGDFKKKSYSNNNKRSFYSRKKTAA